MLFQQLLDQVQSLIQQDCNYSNLEKIKCESVWDEESGCWKISEPGIQKNHLPAGKRSVGVTVPSPGFSWAHQQVNKQQLDHTQLCHLLCTVEASAFPPNLNNNLMRTKLAGSTQKFGQVGDTNGRAGTGFPAKLSVLCVPLAVFKQIRCPFKSCSS